MLLHSRKEIEPKTPLEFLTFIISYGEDVVQSWEWHFKFSWRCMFIQQIKVNFDIYTINDGTSSGKNSLLPTYNKICQN